MSGYEDGLTKLHVLTKIYQKVVLGIENSIPAEKEEPAFEDVRLELQAPYTAYYRAEESP